VALAGTRGAPTHWRHLRGERRAGLSGQRLKMWGQCQANPDRACGGRERKERARGADECRPDGHHRPTARKLRLDVISYCASGSLGRSTGAAPATRTSTGGCTNSTASSLWRSGVPGRETQFCRLSRSNPWRRFADTPTQGLKVQRVLREGHSIRLRSRTDPLGSTARNLRRMPKRVAARVRMATINAEWSREM
jgi:hypothetical protein